MWGWAWRSLGSLGLPCILLTILAGLPSAPQLLSVEQGAGGGDASKPSSSFLEDVVCVCVRVHVV